MEYIFIFAICGLVFGLCWLLDKGYTKLFRSKAQHRSGLSVRQNKRYGSMGFILFVLGVAALIFAEGNTALLVGSGILMVLGAGFVVFYLTFGIYYDEDSFLVESFGKKPLTYFYRDIAGQKLYTVQGGSLIIELYMTDDSVVQVVSTMPDYEKFLNYAFSRWCAQKGIDPEACDFHDTANSIWFPGKEET